MTGCDETSCEDTARIGRIDAWSVCWAVCWAVCWTVCWTAGYEETKLRVGSFQILFQCDKCDYESVTH